MPVSRLYFTIFSRLNYRDCIVLHRFHVFLYWCLSVMTTYTCFTTSLKNYISLRKVYNGFFLLYAFEKASCWIQTNYYPKLSSLGISTRAPFEIHFQSIGPARDGIWQNIARPIKIVCDIYLKIVVFILINKFINLY